MVGLCHYIGLNIYAIVVTLLYERGNFYITGFIKVLVLIIYDENNHFNYRIMYCWLKNNNFNFTNLKKELFKFKFHFNLIVIKIIIL